MLEISNKTNLLEQKSYKYSLQDVAEPNLYRDLYTYDDIPRVAFNHRRLPMGMPKEIWITDTTFRDGQQSRAPYSTEQIVTIFDYLHKLGGPNGMIRASEFFLSANACCSAASAFASSVFSCCSSSDFICSS